MAIQRKFLPFTSERYRIETLFFLMFLTVTSVSESYPSLLVGSTQHVTEKQALAKAIGKVFVTQTQSFTFGSVLVPHC